MQVLNRSHKHITDVLQVLNRSHKHIIDVLQVLNRSHKHITTSQPMGLFCKFVPIEVRNTSPLFCESSKKSQTHHHKSTSEDVLQVLNRSHKHITDVLQGLNRSHKHIIDVLQVLNRSHKHITTSQPMRMYSKFLKNAVRNTSPLFCKSSTEVTLKHITDVLQVLNRSHKHIIDVLQVLNRSHKHITTSQPMGLFCKFVPIEVRNTSPLFCESSKKSQTHHHKSTSEDVLQVLNRSHKHITDVLQGLNRSHKHIIDVLQVLNRSHKHITTSQPMRMYSKFLKNAVRNTSPLFCKSSTEVTLKHITDVLQVLNRSHKHIIDVLQVLNRSHQHITTSQPMGLFCKFVPIEVRNASPLFCESSKKSQTHHHKSTSEDVLQVLNRSHKHITDVLQVLNRSHKHIIDVLQVLNRSHKHITTRTNEDVLQVFKKRR